MTYLDAGSWSYNRARYGLCLMELAFAFAFDSVGVLLLLRPMRYAQENWMAWGEEKRENILKREGKRIWQACSHSRKRQC